MIYRVAHMSLNLLYISADDRNTLEVKADTVIENIIDWLK